MVTDHYYATINDRFAAVYLPFTSGHHRSDSKFSDRLVKTDLRRLAIVGERRQPPVW